MRKGEVPDRREDRLLVDELLHPMEDRLAPRRVQSAVCSRKSRRCRGTHGGRLPPGTFYYRTRRRDVTPLRMRLRELTAARPRFGYRRLHILLRRDGWRINATKTYRLYREEALGMPVKRRHKRASHLRVFPARSSRPKEQWCMDFMADRLEDGRRHATAAAASMRFLTGTVPHVAFHCRAGML